MEQPPWPTMILLSLVSVGVDLWTSLRRLCRVLFVAGSSAGPA